MRGAANALEWVWNGLEPAERVVASALAEAGPGVVGQEELKQRLKNKGVRVLIGKLQDAPCVLEDYGLIAAVKDGYRFQVELLRRWIATRKSLAQVQDDVSRIEPVANGLFEAAYNCYQTRQFEQAVPLLHQAIGLNPNHMQANQLLAEILLAQGEVDEAGQLLESLYEYQPAVRPRLVQALLLQARAVKGEEQLAHYKRVLQLEPHQPEAIAGYQRVWKKRGDEAMAAGSPKEALAAYQKADLPEKIVEAGVQYIIRLEQEKKHQTALELASSCTTNTPRSGINYPANGWLRCCWLTVNWPKRSKSWRSFI